MSIDAETVTTVHEHSRLYDALETAAQRAEIAGHNELAASLRVHRHEVTFCINAGRCRERSLDPAESDHLTRSALALEDELAYEPGPG